MHAHTGRHYRAESLFAGRIQPRAGRRNHVGQNPSVVAVHSRAGRAGHPGTPAGRSGHENAFPRWKGYHAEENVVGYYNTGDRTMYWGSQGAFRGRMRRVLFGAALFVIPAVRPLLARGASGCLDSSGRFRGCGDGGRFECSGSRSGEHRDPRDSVLQYETAVKVDKFLLVAHRTHDEVAHSTGRTPREPSFRVTVHSRQFAKSACSRYKGQNAK